MSAGVDSPRRALIVYGSSRGTTGKIAEAIAEGLETRGVSVSTVPIPLLRLMPDRIRTVDLVGIGSPTYFLREPLYVTDFLSSLTAIEGKKVFVFCTCGMERPGETLYRMSSMAAKRGGTVIGANAFRAAMSYYPHLKRGLGNPQTLPDDRELQSAREFGERMSAPHLAPTSVPPPRTSERFKARLLASRRFRRTFFPGVMLKRTDCTGYGSCLSRCPFEALVRIDGNDIPEINERCVQCLECIRDCPRSAIVPDSPIKEWISTLSYRLGLH